jgi:hypothetical protein
VPLHTHANPGGQVVTARVVHVLHVWDGAPWHNTTAQRTPRHYFFWDELRSVLLFFYASFSRIIRCLSSCDKNHGVPIHARTPLTVSPSVPTTNGTRSRILCPLSFSFASNTPWHFVLIKLSLLKKMKCFLCGRLIKVDCEWADVCPASSHRLCHDCYWRNVTWEEFPRQRGVFWKRKVHGSWTHCVRVQGHVKL